MELNPDRDQHPGHADPDWYQCQAYEKVDNYQYFLVFSPQNFNTQNYDIFDADETDKTSVADPDPGLGAF